VAVRIIRPGEYGAVIRTRIEPAVVERRVIHPPDSIKLGTGEYVSKSEFGKLTAAEQAYLKKQGVSAFNIEQERVHRPQVKAYEEAVAYIERETAKQEEWVKKNIMEVGPEKEPILRAAFEKMTPDAQELLRDIGIAEFNIRVKEQETRVAEQKKKIVRFEAAHTQLPDGQWIDNKQLTKLKTEAPNIYEALTTSGFAAVDKIIADRQEAFATLKGYGVYPYSEALMYELVKSGQYTVPEIMAKREKEIVGWDLARYLKDHPENTTVLVAAGFDPADVTAAKLASQSYGVPVLDLSADEKIELLEPLQFKDETTGKTINIHTLIKREGEGIVDKVWNEINPDWKANLVTAQAQHIRKRDWEIGIIPVAGTVYLWDRMPTWAKSVSIAGDVLFFACLTGVNPLKLVAPRLLQRVPKATTIYKQVIASNVDEAVKVLGGVDPKLLKPFQGAVKAATSYADDFTRVKALQFTIDQCDDILRSGRLAKGTTQYQAVVDLLAQSTDNLARATKAAAASKGTLLRLTGEYTDDITRRLVSAPDILDKGQRTLLESLKGIPKRLVSSIEDVAVPPTVDVATLQAQLLTGKNALLAAKTKFPLDPTKWIDLVDDVARLEGKLLNARIGNVQVLYNQLLAARQTLPELQKVLKTLGKGTVQYDEMVSEITRVKSLIETLPKQVDDAIKAMQIEVIPGGYWGGSVAVISPTDIAKLTTLTTPATTFELTKTGLLPLTTAIAAKVIVPVTLKPEAPLVIPITPSITEEQLAGVKPLTSSQVKNITGVTGLTQTQVKAVTGSGALAEVLSVQAEVVGAVLGEASQAAIGAFNKAVAEGATSTEAEAAAQTAAQSAIQSAIQPAIQSATAAMVNVGAQAAAQTAAETAIKAATQTLVKTAVQTAVGITPTPVTPFVPFIPIIPPIPEGKRKWTPEEAKGAIAWKQGFIWVAIKRPYKSTADVAFFKKLPPGVTIVKGGPKSAYRSIQAITGKAPTKLLIDMGIMDITVKKPSKTPGKKGAIKFTRDIKQKTRGDISIGKTPKVVIESEEVPLIKTGKTGKAPKTNSASREISLGADIVIDTKHGKTRQHIRI